MENTGGGGELTLIVGFCQMFTQVTTKRSFPENNQTNDLLWFVQFTPSKIRALWQIQGFFKTTAESWINWTVFRRVAGWVEILLKKKNLLNSVPKFQNWPDTRNLWESTINTVQSKIGFSSKHIFPLQVLPKVWRWRSLLGTGRSGFSPYLALSFEWIIPFLREITKHGSCRYDISWLTLGYQFASVAPLMGEKTRTTSKKTRFSLASWQLKERMLYFFKIISTDRQPDSQTDRLKANKLNLTTTIQTMTDRQTDRQTDRLNDDRLIDLLMADRQSDR